uniref:Ska2 N-terminal domain-containing protein n=1 Tax=Anopheles epiroticus TaxID=199890 RepID=A0A182PRH0_9DIPT
MISNALCDLEKCVDTAGVQLDSLALKLTDVERNLDENELESLENESVMELLESVTEVKNEYQNLRKDLQEVQQLQKEMTNSLRYQLRNMTQTFRGLKKKIESNSIPVHLVPPPAGSSSRNAAHDARGEMPHHPHPPHLLLPQPDLTVHDHGPRRATGMLKSGKRTLVRTLRALYGQFVPDLVWTVFYLAHWRPLRVNYCKL